MLKKHSLLLATTLFCPLLASPSYGQLTCPERSENFRPPDCPQSPTTPPPRPPIGVFETADVNKRKLTGYAFDPDLRSAPVTVNIFANETLVSSIISDKPRGTENNGFEFTIPTIYRDETTYRWRAVAVDYEGQSTDLGLKSIAFPRNPVPIDFDGDRKADFSHFRPSNGSWYSLLTSDGKTLDRQWGLSTDIPIPGDYDGDGKVDHAMWRPGEGIWYVLQSANNVYRSFQFGWSDDVPAPADYDGDAITDVAVFRPSNGTWYLRQSDGGVSRVQQWGWQGDIPVAADYDGDGKADIAVFRPSEGTWYVRRSKDGTLLQQQWGQQGDIPLPSDYDKDRKDDFTVYRPNVRTFFALRSNEGFTSAIWGAVDDVAIGAPLIRK